MSDLVSVIVPIYKVENYLDKCVESIVNQTYKNLEIILVDDGSPDNCPQMCDTWAKKDSRIKVIHKPNGGLSDARNAGMKVATGEYVAFVDSDDFVDEHYSEYLLKAILVSGAKMAACDLAIYYDGDPIAQKVMFGTINIKSSEEAICDILHNRCVRAVAWNKMFHKELLADERFPVGKYHEDEFFSYRIIHKAEKLVYVDSKLYYYRQRQGSIMASFNSKHLDSLEAGLERLDLLNRYYPNLYTYDKGIFCTGCVQLYRTALRCDCDKKAIKKEIYNYRKKVVFNKSEFRQYSVKQRIYLFGGRYCLGLFAFVLNAFEGNSDG